MLMAYFVLHAGVRPTDWWLFRRKHMRYEGMICVEKCYEVDTVVPSLDPHPVI